MRLTLRPAPEEVLPGVRGPARVDRRTGSLLDRLRPGDVAVLDHLDLDRTTAQALVERGVAAVVNASSFISGRYPHLGPQLLADAGVTMVDAVGTSVLNDIKDGVPVRLHDGVVLVDGSQVAAGRELGRAEVAELLDAARTGVSAQLMSLTHNTTDFLRREQELLLHGEGIPRTRTDLRGRPVVVVSSGPDDRRELRLLRRFVHEQRPVLVGVGAGADALLAAGHRPDLVVVGEQAVPDAGTRGLSRTRTVSDEALRSAEEVVLHLSSSQQGAGPARLDRLAIPHQVLRSTGRTEDLALLLADVGGADLVVTVGAHARLEDLLDRQRDDLAGTSLIRLRVGPKLVAAESLAMLYAGRVRLWHLALVLLTGLVLLAAAVLATPAGQDWWSQLGDALSDLPEWSRGLR